MISPVCVIAPWQCLKQHFQHQLQTQCMSSAGQVQKPRCSVLPFAFQVLSRWLCCSLQSHLLLHSSFCHSGRSSLFYFMYNSLAAGPLQTAVWSSCLSKGVFGWGLWLVDLPVVEASSVQSLLQMYLTKGCGWALGSYEHKQE